MRETPLSNCERRFLLRAVREGKVGAARPHPYPCPFTPPRGRPPPR